MKCINHPDRAGNGYCERYERYLCEDCMQCQDPSLYCKFRKQCIVWEFWRHGMEGDFPEPDTERPEAEVSTSGDDMACKAPDDKD